MRSFDQLLGLLSNIPDPRRAEGKLVATTCPAVFLDPCCRHRRQFYRSIVTASIKVHRRRLNAALRSALAACPSPYLYSI